MIAYISFEFVLGLHDQLIEEYRGVKGILSEGLLHPALEMPKGRFDGRDLSRTIYDKKAAYSSKIIHL